MPPRLPLLILSTAKQKTRFTCAIPFSTLFRLLEADAMKTIREETPRYIRVHEADNVAIVVNDNGLTAGSVFPAGCG